MFTISPEIWLNRLVFLCWVGLLFPGRADCQQYGYGPVMGPPAGYYRFGDRPALPALPENVDPRFGTRPALPALPVQRAEGGSGFGMRPALPPLAVAPVVRPLSPIGARSRLAASIGRESQRLATMRLNYRYGSMDPDSGGLDCSGAVKCVLERSGLRGVPRTASEQFVWLQNAGTLTALRPGANPDWILSRLKPGDLLFWRGTYVTNRWPDVSHVMIYLGRHPATGQPMMFGARSSSGLRGINGNAVDVFEFNPVSRGKSQFIGFGSVPG